MDKSFSKSKQNTESKRFNENASRILIARGYEEISQLFQSLEYECGVVGPGKLLMPCPTCLKSDLLILTNGTVYPILWKCLNLECPSKSNGSFKNLVGLVRACTGSLGSAYKAIAAHLGFGNPYDITNLNEAMMASLIRNDDT